MEMRSRYRGCLLAGAIGDALGYQVEFEPLREILAEHGPQGVHRLAPKISDDTQMTLFTAEGMLLGKRHGMPLPECVHQAYLDWLYTQDGKYPGGAFRKEDPLLKELTLHAWRAPGNTCLSALESGRMGTMDRPLNNSKGCGGVMRTAPCGLMRLPGLPDTEDVWALQGAMAAAITHGHLMGYVPAAMLADLVHRIVSGEGKPFRQLVRESLTRMMRLFGPDMRDAQGCEDGAGASDGRFAQMLAFREMVERALKLAQTDMPSPQAIEAIGGGWVGDEALAIAVYCVAKYPDDMESCLSAAVTHSGDSDSTGAIAGNLIGAMLGEAGIPAPWRGGVECWDLIAGMADRLLEEAQ